ncbi:MAG: hypothetical protein AB1585_17690 [Thermodesulfobacteriota bacterium]
MATKKSTVILFGILVVLAWVLGSPILAGAETKNFKYFSYPSKVETFLVGDVDGHRVSFSVGKTFFLLEDGDIAVSNQVVTSDMIKFLGSWNQYGIWKFTDGSTITLKVQGTLEEGGKASIKSEIIKGTGRFEGAKGSSSSKMKYLPMEKGDIAAVGYGEGTLTYTLPKK